MGIRQRILRQVKEGGNPQQITDRIMAMPEMIHASEVEKIGKDIQGMNSEELKVHLDKMAVTKGGQVIHPILDPDSVSKWLEERP